ncbi:MAG: hypothetical protein KPEEDBHJ_00590 [Anaerolineales bacterium]|nr:hypothetical protein [Anaerolineales bacterium]
MQRPARASRHALAAGQAFVVYDRLPAPGMSADVYADGAVIRADAALHAAMRVGDDNSRRKRDAAYGWFLEYVHCRRLASSVLLESRRFYYKFCCAALNSIESHIPAFFTQIKTGSSHDGPARIRKYSVSYETGTTLAACKPFGPSSMENSTFCSASSLR